jgi:hypothetical protein
VLRGGRETFRQFSPVLFLELHNEMILAQGGDRDAALDELKNLGYSVFSLDGMPIDPTTIFDKDIVRIVARRRD